jgi:very-short-patch-repair endonuclease
MEILTIINDVQIIKNYVQNLPKNPALKLLAREKRKAGILSEVLFWQQVHKGVFYKIDFDRQIVIGNFIVDFYVKKLGLIIEIDGSSHDDKQEYDAIRQNYLEGLGLKFFRCTDLEIKFQLGIVMNNLEQFIVEQYGVKKND